jgi:hypothetical protein
MVRKIKVKSVSGLALSHPSAGVIRPGGSSWPLDQFTMRRLADKSIEEVKESASAKPAQQQPAQQQK